MPPTVSQQDAVVEKGEIVSRGSERDRIKQKQGKEIIKNGASSLFLCSLFTAIEDAHDMWASLGIEYPRWNKA